MHQIHHPVPDIILRDRRRIGKGIIPDVCRKDLGLPACGMVDLRLGPVLRRRLELGADRRLVTRLLRDVVATAQELLSVFGIGVCINFPEILFLLRALPGCRLLPSLPCVVLPVVPD